MINDYFRVTGAHDTVLDYADLFSVTLHDDNVQEFDTRWDEVLLPVSKIPSDDILESLYKLRIRESEKLKTVLYDMDIHQKISVPNYQKLKTMVKRSIDQKLRLRNFDARHGRIGTGAVVKIRRGMSGVEAGKGTCYQWTEKGQCSKGDQCSFRHESNDRAQKPDHNAATPSEPSLSRGRRVLRKRSIRGKGNHGSILRQPCRYYLKGTCTRTPCEYWHPPECQFYKTETGCKAADKCLFPHHKVDEQPKKPKKGYYSHKRKESDDKNAVAIVKKRITTGLCITRSRCTGFSRKKVSGKPDPGRPKIRSSSTIRVGKRIVKNTCQKSSSAKSLRNEDRSHEETERQQRCARSKAWNLAKNIYKLKEKDKATFYSPAGEWVLPAASTKEPEEREFVVDSGAGMHRVRKRDLNCAELETMRTSRSPTTVMTANGEVQTRGEATKNVKELELLVTVMLLEETPAVLSLGKLCEDHGYSYPWTSGQKPHLIRNGKRIDCEQNMCHSGIESSTSSSPTSTSSSQDSVMGKENPATERSGSMTASRKPDAQTNRNRK